MGRSPHHNLQAFQASAAAERISVTRTARNSADELGFGLRGIATTIAAMRSDMFYKSMESKQNPGQWQDVYHVPSAIGALYVKFTDEGILAFKILSFKRK